ncbi:MAG: tetratricopeptide repeat protein [Paludibacter sp.]|nr:tetratricopeptide repeat protein [Paludibacter sp.]
MFRKCLGKIYLVRATACRIIPILFVLLVGCSLLPNDLKTAETALQTNPDSALSILKKMNPSNFISDADRALYGLLYFEALDNTKGDLKPDSLIDFSLSYYLRSNNNVRLAKSYFYKAKTLKVEQRFDDATVLYLKAIDLVKNTDESLLLGKIYSDIGDICSIQKDYKESLNKYKTSISFFKRSGDSIEISYSLTYTGRVYRFMKEYDTALKFYKQALNYTKDSLSNGLAYQEMGINYFMAKKYDLAQRFLRKSLTYPAVSNYYAIRNFILADLFFEKQQYDSAALYATTALKYPSTFFVQRDCYRILVNTEYGRGDFKQMAAYMSKYQDCTDSVRKIETQTKTTVLEDLYQTSDKVGKTRRYLLLSGFIIALIAALSVFVVYRLRLRNKGKDDELKQVEKTLSKKQELLRENLLQKIEETRTLQMVVYKKSSISEREEMDREMYRNILHVEDRQAFARLMDKTFNNVFSNLETRFPELTYKELIWCCLFLLGLPNNEIALILDSQPASLYKMKQRIGQKMNLASTRDLPQMLSDLSEK